MTLDYSSYGITPLAHDLPEGTLSLKQGSNWRAALAKETSPVLMTPEQRRMMLTLLPMLKTMYVNTLRRTVLGEDTMRGVLRPGSLLHRATQEEVAEHSLPYQQPFTPAAHEIDLYAPKPTPPEPEKKPTGVMLPSPEEIEEYTAREHTEYARRKALKKETVEILNEHFGHIKERLAHFAVMLYEDTDAAERLLEETSEIAREAAQVVKKHYGGSPLHERFAAEDVTHEVETILEDVLTDALRDLPKDQAVIDQYLESARILIARHIDSHPGVWR